jgi:hypothetical protein
LCVFFILSASLDPIALNLISCGTGTLPVDEGKMETAGAIDVAEEAA